MSGVPVLLITANVGSIFEEPGVMLKIWTEEFLSTVSRLDPKFIALHCQEVGGKNYEQSMRHVEDFVRLLMSSEELRLFDKVTVFLDEDFSSAEHFTALGNFYFIHESLKDVLLWDFKEYKFIPVHGKEVHSGNIEAVTTKEKAKFPQDFFPECKWSRKGFLRTRWNISGTIFDLINIHLFHDASNFVAMETFPSVYSKTRRRALEHTLERFHNDQYQTVPYFLFGDFNFRTDTSGVIKKLTEDTHENQLLSKGNISKLQFRNNDENLILTLGKKEFSHHEHRQVFAADGGQWLREYDRELEDFEGRLFEFPVEFVPSYPFEEDINQGSNYMQTRVPAWCDRILLSPTAKLLVENISSGDPVEYGIIGPTTCMGDHKPVYLRAIVSSDAGMINCCSTCPLMCFRVPEHYVELLSMLPDCHSNFSQLQQHSTTIASDRYSSSKLLHALPVEHDPYTPDSMDSPSPSAFVLLPNENYVHNNEQIIERVDNKIFSMNNKRFDMAVSPTLLKSKLEIVVQNKERAKRKRQRSDLVDYDVHSWPKKDDQQMSVRQYVTRRRCNSESFNHKSSNYIRPCCSSFEIYSSNSSPVEELNKRNLIIPKIAIINPSNFQSNESSMDFQDERLMISYRYLSSGRDGTSGEGSSLELDTSEERQEFEKDSDHQVYSRTQDSGIDTLDVEDAYSRGESLGVSSDETTISTGPMGSQTDGNNSKIKNASEQYEKKLLIHDNDDNDDNNDEKVQMVVDEAKKISPSTADDEHIQMHTPTSGDTTPCYSSHSQDSFIDDDDNNQSENQKGKIRNYVRYRRDIINKGSRSRKCCCVVS
ncbi:hypothetical protein PV326_005793 [Microctonus aethiopoides]|nr:hypothetical protein PV326_005793 [Microctonus aethiopoides]